MPASSGDVRAKFIAAALDLQLEVGLDEPSIVDVCTRAGFARATFYEYFADREALIAATLDALVGHFVDLVVDDDPGDVRAMVQRFMVAMGTGDRVIGGTGAWSFRDTLRVLAKSPRVRAGYVSRVSELGKRIEANVLLGQRAGKVRADVSPAAISGLLVGLAFGAIAMIDFGAEVDFAAVANGLVTTLEARGPERGT
ncbi:MAG: TetR/AcrR family transcriptional regulator [Polyangiaceae bacterium]